MSSGIVFYGEALATAMLMFREASNIAGKLSTAADGVSRGAAIIKEASEALLQIIDDYLSRDVKQMSLEQYGMHEKDLTTGELNETMSALSKFINDVKTAGTGALTEEQKEQFEVLFNNMIKAFGVSPIYNSNEYEMFAIEPPSNPVFIPKKLKEIPQGMDLYEIVCPDRVYGVGGPTVTDCNTCINPCMRNQCNNPDNINKGCKPKETSCGCGCKKKSNKKIKRCRGN